MEDEIKKKDGTPEGDAPEVKETEAEKKARLKAEKEAAKAAEVPKNPRDEMTVEEYLNEKVPFYAIWDGERYKDDINETINGKTWQIKRGVHVEIPRFVYEAIMASERQKVVATSTSMVAEKRFDDLANNKIL